jgi:gas vesicle protein
MNLNVTSLENTALRRGGHTMRKLFNFLLGFLLGALVGAATAMLLAPGAGEQTRQQIQLQMDQILEEGRRAASERRAELETQLEQLKKGKPSIS